MLFEKQITSIDQSDMFHKILEFPEQILRGWEIGEKNRDIRNITGFRYIVLSGMGGSAIGGDIVRSLLGNGFQMPVFVNRSYWIPAFCDNQTFFIASSYSGNTEETLSALAKAQEKACSIICMTSGGHLQKTAEQKKYPLFILPQGYPPRATLGYGLGILLSVFKKLGVGKVNYRELMDSVAFLKQIGESWKSVGDSNNLPLNVAQKLQGKIPLIYSSVEELEGVGFRWKTQLNENSKIHAFYQPIPEMNHNEIVPWESLPGTKKYFSDLVMILLQLPSNYPRVRLRMDIMKNLIEKNEGQVIEVMANGENVLSQLLYLIYLGDWVSYYLAILLGVDPATIRNIDYLKNQLSKKS